MTSDPFFRPEWPIGGGVRIRAGGSRSELPSEGHVRAAAERGETVRYWSVPTYENDSLVPSGINLKAIGDKGLNMRIFIPNVPKVSK